MCCGPASLQHPKGLWGISDSMNMTGVPHLTTNSTLYLIAATSIALEEIYINIDMYVCLFGYLDSRHDIKRLIAGVSFVILLQCCSTQLSSLLQSETFHSRKVLYHVECNIRQ